MQTMLSSKTDIQLEQTITLLGGAHASHFIFTWFVAPQAPLAMLWFAPTPVTFAAQPALLVSVEKI